MATDYTYLYEEYPEVISADQLYRICHISKRKAKWLLEHGYIPCEDSGKKTRRYKIRLNDVIDYQSAFTSRNFSVKMLLHHPVLEKTPPQTG